MTGPNLGAGDSAVRNEQRALSQQSGGDTGRPTVPSPQTEPQRPALLVGQAQIPCRVCHLMSVSREPSGGQALSQALAPQGSRDPPRSLPSGTVSHTAHVLLACGCGSGDLSWTDLRPWEAEAASQTRLGQKGRGQRCVCETTASALGGAHRRPLPSLPDGDPRPQVR